MSCKLTLDKIMTLLDNTRDQFLIVGLDNTVISVVKSYISKNSSYKPVTVTYRKELDPSNKIFFINLENTSAMQYQSLLYYYLELPLKYDCFVCRNSNSCLCLNSFEKRVRSRFKHKIFFFRIFRRISYQ